MARVLAQRWRWGQCPQAGWRALTDYDDNSIMQASNGVCGGSPIAGLTALDGVGMASLYGLPPALLMALNTK